MRGWQALIIILALLSPAFAVEPICDACYKSRIWLTANDTVAVAKLSFTNISYYFDVIGTLQPWQTGINDVPRDAGGNPIPMTEWRLVLNESAIANASVYFDFIDESASNASDENGTVLCQPSAGNEYGIVTCNFSILQKTGPGGVKTNRTFDEVGQCVYVTARFEGRQESGYFIKPGRAGAILCPARSGAFSNLWQLFLAAATSNMAFCVPLLIVGGMLLAAMYHSGRNPLGLFDITAPRLPATKNLRIGRTTLPWMMSAKASMTNRLAKMAERVQKAAFAQLAKADAPRAALLRAKIEGILKKTPNLEKRLAEMTLAFEGSGIIKSASVRKAYSAIMQSEQLKGQLLRDSKAVVDGRIASQAGYLQSPKKLSGRIINTLVSLEKPFQNIPFLGSTLVGRSRESLVRLVAARQGNIAVRKRLFKAGVAEGLRAAKMDKMAPKFMAKFSPDKKRMGGIVDAAGRMVAHSALLANYAHDEVAGKIFAQIKEGIEKRIKELEDRLRELQKKSLAGAPELKRKEHADEIANLKKSIAALAVMNRDGSIKDDKAKNELVRTLNKIAQAGGDENANKAIISEMLRFAEKHRVDVELSGIALVKNGVINKENQKKIIAVLDEVAMHAKEGGYLVFKDGKYQADIIGKAGQRADFAKDLDPLAIRASYKLLLGVLQGEGARILDIHYLLRENNGGMNPADIYARRFAEEAKIKNVGKWPDILREVKDDRMREGLLALVGGAMLERFRLAAEYSAIRYGKADSMKKVWEAVDGKEGAIGKLDLKRSTDFGLRHGLHSEAKLSWGGNSEALSRRVERLLGGLDKYYGDNFESLLNRYDRTARRNLDILKLIEQNAKRLGEGGLDAESYKRMLARGVLYGDLRKGVWMASSDGNFFPIDMKDASQSELFQNMLISKFAEKPINAYVLIRQKNGEYVHGDPKKDSRVAAAIEAANAAIDPAAKIRLANEIYGDGKSGLVRVVSTDDYWNEKRQGGFLAAGKKLMYNVAIAAERAHVGGLYDVNKGLMDWYCAQLQTRLELNKWSGMVTARGDADFMSDDYRRLKDRETGKEREIADARGELKEARHAGDAMKVMQKQAEVDRLMAERKQLMASVRDNSLDRSLMNIKNQEFNYYNITESSAMRDPRIAIGAGYGIASAIMVGYQTGQFVYERPSMVFGMNLLPGDANANWLLRPGFWTAVAFSHMARPFYTSIIGYPSVYDMDMFHGASMRKGTFFQAMAHATSPNQTLEIFHRLTLPRWRRPEEYFTEEGFKITDDRSAYGKRYLGLFTFRRDISIIERERLAVLGIDADADVRRRMLGAPAEQRTHMRMELAGIHEEMDRLRQQIAERAAYRMDLERIMREEEGLKNSASGSERKLIDDRINDMRNEMSRIDEELARKRGDEQSWEARRQGAERLKEKPLEKIPFIGKIFGPGYYNIMNLGGADVSLQGAKMRGADLYSPYHKSGIDNPPVPGMLDSTDGEYRPFPRVASHIFDDPTLEAQARFRKFGISDGGEYKDYGGLWEGTRSMRLEGLRDVYRHDDPALLRLITLENERMGYGLASTPFGVPLSPLIGAAWFGLPIPGLRKINLKSLFNDRPGIIQTMPNWSGGSEDIANAASAAYATAADPAVASGAAKHARGIMSAQDRLDRFMQTDYLFGREFCRIHGSYSAYGAKCPKCEGGGAMQKEARKYGNWLDKFQKNAEEVGKITEQVSRDERARLRNAVNASGYVK